MTVAALCVHPRSIYRQLQSVECYDVRRDVRTFAGGMPVVAHPPCRSWSAFCRHQAKPLPGEKELGPLCVDWLRKCGGVLEHPAYSHLFAACGLPRPGAPAVDGVWTAAVSQAWWGGPVTKNTWLAFFGIARCKVDFPFALRNRRGADGEIYRTLSSQARAATPAQMAEWLVGVARSAS